MDETLYVLNLSLLVTHQIDSAYWKEWELLHIPGGPQLNLVLNLMLLIVFLAGFRALLDGARAGQAAALLLAAAGLFAVCLHGYFIWRGDPRFRLPASITVLIAALPVSLWQGALALRGLAA